MLFVMTAERTFIAIKPDGVQRGLVGEILGRFERKGFKLVGLKQITPSRELAEQPTASTRSALTLQVWWSSSLRVLSLPWSGKVTV